MGEMDRRPSEAMLNKGGSVPRQEGNKGPQYMFTIAATMSAFCAGTALAWTGPGFKTIVISAAANATNATGNATDTAASGLLITEYEGTWVASLLNVGALAGALPAGYFTNLFGRKIVCASLAVPFLLSWVIVSFASKAWHLYVARLIVGLATGASSAVAPMYVGEIAESSVRGSLGSFFQLMLTVGILFTFVLGAYTSYAALAIGCGLAPLVFLIMFFGAPETPAYLLSKGRRIQAEEALRRLRGPDYDVSYEIAELQKEINRSEANRARFSDLFTRKAALTGLIISLGLMLFQQLSGINAVIFFANSIFKDAGSQLNPDICAIIIGVIQVVSTYISTILVDKAGRKILLQLSSAVMALCLGLLGYYFYLKDSGSDVANIGLLPLGSLGVFIIIFSLGFGPIPWMMTGELFASDVKGSATGIAVGLNWFLAFIVTKNFQPLKEVIGTHWAFGLFGIICVMAVAFVTLFVPETKGKSLDEIQQILGGESSKRKNPV